MGHVRPFTVDDIPQVAELVTGQSLQRANTDADRIKTFFTELYFNNPWCNESIPSLLYETESKEVIGFLGVIPRWMSLNGDPSLVAVANHFKVHPLHRSSMAGLHLLRKFFSGPQDFSLGDTANSLSRKIWEGLGGQTSILHSMYWTRVLRPSQYLMHYLKQKRQKFTIVETITRPICSIIDAIASRIPPQNELLKPKPQYIEEDLSEESLLQCINEFSHERSLKPEYDNNSMNWLFKNLSQKRKYGTFHKVLIRDIDRRIIGWYLWYLNVGGVGEVLQVMANKHSMSDVLDHLFHVAWREGVTALVGRVEPSFIDVFTDKYCIITPGRYWTLVHSNDHKFLEMILLNDVFLTRLEGEFITNFPF